MGWVGGGGGGVGGVVGVVGGVGGEVGGGVGEVGGVVGGGVGGTQVADEAFVPVSGRYTMNPMNDSIREAVVAHMLVRLIEGIHPADVELEIRKWGVGDE